MDLQAVELSAHAEQEVNSATFLSWKDWEVPFPVILCAFASAAIFTFLVIIHISTIYVNIHLSIIFTYK